MWGWARMIKSARYIFPPSGGSTAGIAQECESDLWDAEIQFHQHRGPGTQSASFLVFFSARILPPTSWEADQ